MAKAGLPLEHAMEAVGHTDQTMGGCILRLYRSGVEVGKQWQPGLVNVRGSRLVFWGAGDTACPVTFADELASDTNAGRFLKLNARHWTIVERSAETAEALENHWASVDDTTRQVKGEQ